MNVYAPSQFLVKFAYIHTYIKYLYNIEQEWAVSNFLYTIRSTTKHFKQCIQLTVAPIFNVHLIISYEYIRIFSVVSVWCCMAVCVFGGAALYTNGKKWQNTQGLWYGWILFLVNEKNELLLCLFDAFFIAFTLGSCVVLVPQ